MLMTSRGSSSSLCLTLCSEYFMWGHYACYCPHGLFPRPTLWLASIGVSCLYCRWTSCAIHLVAVVVILSHGCSDKNLTPCAFARVITHFHISEFTIPCVCMAFYRTYCVTSGLHQCVPLRALLCGNCLCAHPCYAGLSSEWRVTA